MQINIEIPDDKVIKFKNAILRVYPNNTEISDEQHIIEIIKQFLWDSFKNGIGKLATDSLEKKQDVLQG